MNVRKRAFDVAMAAAGVVVTAPLLASIAAAIKMSDHGPVFFRQERVGYRGRLFRIWKFRTMVVDAERRGRQITVGDDSRITPVGKWLRKLKLDELPQLFNVLAGDMSIVGPRPEVPRYVSLYDDQQRNVLDLMPGITDPASIKYCNESEILAQSADPEREYIAVIMPEKIELNLQYAARASVIHDIGIIARTIRRIVVE